MEAGQPHPLLIEVEELTNVTVEIENVGLEKTEVGVGIAEIADTPTGVRINTITDVARSKLENPLLPEEIPGPRKETFHITVPQRRTVGATNSALVIVPRSGKVLVRATGPGVRVFEPRGGGGL